ncbi:MAG: hypothetical protein KDC76_09540 [Bacteroidetes bacterium]|nr:hypothetical protein [Bacteroidota bacterium]
MIFRKPLALLILVMVTFISWGLAKPESDNRPSYYPTSKPIARWWWFATDVQNSDIAHQLNWAKDMNFGGVEIAWVYPLHRFNRLYKQRHGIEYEVDSTAPEWLSVGWVEHVVFAKKYCDSIGLSCDFTFGSAWPIAGNIPEKFGTKVYGDTAFRQWLTFGWTWPQNQLVIDHLDSQAFHLFSQPIQDALKEPLKGTKSALFTDSWEIKMNSHMKIWTTGFEDKFRHRFGYDILPYMEQHLDSFPDVRYDYMMLLGDLVTDGFYKPYVDACQEMNAWSRVQCLASPTDILTTYSLVDIPETEAMLNNPEYSTIVSSSAVLSGKKMVSSESFTCLYGFPDTYLKRENTADLKLVVDALFAQGVNQHVYHGMPYNPEGCDSNLFFATTYFGPGGSLEPELPAFNTYVEKVSGYLQEGRTYTDVAVYIPYEDAVMKGALPPEQQRVWVWGEYELRYLNFPKEVDGYHPIWINRHFLEQAEFNGSQLVVGDARFNSLYIDVRYMDVRALRRLLTLAKAGLPVCLKQSPNQPGAAKDLAYDSLVTQLRMLPNVSDQFDEINPSKPLIKGASIPDYWCRVQPDGSRLLFIAQPKASNLTYPLTSGQSYMKASEFVEVTIHHQEKDHQVKLEFKPYQSLLLHLLPDGSIQSLDIHFVPKDPVIRPKELQKSFF